VDRNLQIGEARNFYQVAKQFLHDEQPDVIITWGGNQLNRLLINLAGSCCRSLVFHLGNAGYYDCDLFQPFDSIFVATRYFADFYHERLGIRPTVRGSLILEDQFAKPQDVLSTQNPNYRKHGFITFINPSFQKGGTLFARLAAIARQERPDLHFLAVEGRMSKEEWRKTGFDLAHFDNVWWIPNQKDIRSVYSRTSILLFPSFGTEAAGRCLPEAQLGGIPVLAANHSGIPDQLNGGGVLFDIPARCRSNYKNIPTENEVRPWLNVIYQLMDDDQTYREASNVALQAAEKFHPDTMKQRIVQLFEDLPETRGPRTQINVLPPGQRPESASEHIQQERAPCVESVN
jgi:glycosyltransferase involved in cell wall biosynthesis